MNRVDPVSPEGQALILTLFRQVIKFGVEEGMSPDAMAGVLSAFSNSITEQRQPLEWWLEHERGLN